MTEMIRARTSPRALTSEPRAISMLRAFVRIVASFCAFVAPTGQPIIGLYRPLPRRQCKILQACSAAGRLDVVSHVAQPALLVYLQMPVSVS